MAEVMDVQPAVTAVDLPSTESDGMVTHLLHLIYISLKCD